MELLKLVKEIIARAPTVEPSDPDSGNYDDSRDYGMDLQLYYIAEELREALKKDMPKYSDSSTRKRR